MENLQEKKPYVKAELTKQLDTALNLVSQKQGNSKASIVNSALTYYFKNQFPEDFPKSELEILEDVKQEYLHEQTLETYQRIQIGTGNIPNLEKSIEIMKVEIKELEQRLYLKTKSLETSRGEKKKDNPEINNLKFSIEGKKSLLHIHEMMLEEAKTGKKINPL